MMVFKEIIPRGRNNEDGVDDGDHAKIWLESQRILR
jgi:hypothetical protein